MTNTYITKQTRTQKGDGGKGGKNSLKGSLEITMNPLSIITNLLTETFFQLSGTTDKITNAGLFIQHKTLF